MKNVIEFLREKIYYVMAGTVILIILLAVISSCSKKGDRTYLSLEDKLADAAIEYYSTRTDKLPKEEGSSVKVTMGTLVDAEILKKVIVDPKNKEQICEGYVQVKKVNGQHIYIPILKCAGNYEPKKLVDVIKNSKLDEYGNGVYEMGGEYVYRGDDVNNYVKFNNQKWRIIKVDTDNTIELIYAEERNNTRYSYDTDYNSEVEKFYGITTDYLHTDIRKTLVEFYDTNFTDESKAYIAPKDICIGTKMLDDAENAEQECSIVKENEKIGLLRVSDYPKASLDSGCTAYYDAECINRNYMAGSRIDTWLLTTVADNTYQVYVLNSTVATKRAYQTNRIYPVIYLVNDARISSGNGTYEKPYIIKY